MRYELRQFIDYFNNSQTRFLVPEDVDTVDWYHDENITVVGTPDDAIERIKALQAKQGDFGAVLLQAHDWANWDRTKHSYELYARYVIPHFDQANKARDDSYRRVTAHTGQLTDLREAAAQKMFDQHEAERGAIARPGGSQVLS